MTGIWVAGCSWRESPQGLAGPPVPWRAELRGPLPSGQCLERQEGNE